MGITITAEERHGLGGAHTLHVIRRDGDFIIGSQSHEEAQRRLGFLEANDWRHLDCYERGHPEPLAWIDFVRSQGWTFESFSRIEVGPDKRVFFSGNLKECSSAFRYLILDSDLARKVMAAAPEVLVEAAC